MKEKLFWLTTITMAIVAFMFLTSAKSSKNPQPVFKYMQNVQVTTGFYTGILGYITSYGFCDENGKTEVCYTIDIDYGIVQKSLDKQIPESNLSDIIVRPEEK